MDRLAMLFNNVFSKMHFTLILSALIIFSCEEQVDDLWDTDDGTDQISPLVGDWYADSIQSFSGCVNSADSTSDLMYNRSLVDYNLWLLSDGSFQMVLNQNIVLQDECESFYGTWNNSTGCSDSYYSYFDYSPLEFCNVYYEHDQYNIETTECSQDVSIEGTWLTNESSSSVTLSMDSVCVNSFGNPSYLSDSETCQSLEDGNWNATLERTFTYSIDATTGSVSLDGQWFDSSSSCVKFYLSIQ